MSSITQTTRRATAMLPTDSLSNARIAQRLARQSSSSAHTNTLDLIGKTLPANKLAGASEMKPEPSDQAANKAITNSYDVVQPGLTLIGNSRFSKLKIGKKIVQQLREVRRIDVDKSNQLDERSEGTYVVEKDQILIKSNPRATAYSTALTLIHEASHRLWFQEHPGDYGNSIDQEFEAYENEILAYIEFKKEGYRDANYENLLKSYKEGTLRSTLRKAYRAPEHQQSKQWWINNTTPGYGGRGCGARGNCPRAE